MDGIVSAFQGFLGQDPERRYTRQGSPVLNLSVGVKDAKAPEGTPTEWVRVSVFGERADELEGKLHKGSEVYVEGRLRLNQWTNKDGGQRAGLNCSAWKVEPLGAIGRRSGKPGRQTEPGSSSAVADDLEAEPF